jgi:hypothetical protein
VSLLSQHQIVIAFSPAGAVAAGAVEASAAVEALAVVVPLVVLFAVLPQAATETNIARVSKTINTLLNFFILLPPPLIL